MIDLPMSVMLSSFSLTLGATILGSITLFNTSRKTTVDLLVTQGHVMRGEIDELKQHVQTCEKDLSSVRSANEWLIQEIQRKRGWFRMPPMLG